MEYRLKIALDSPDRFGVHFSTAHPENQKSRGFVLPEAGSVLNHRYRWIRPLGEGGMGRVFLVGDLIQGDRLVALKTLRPGLLSDSASERFKQEFRAMARLRHPNLARVYDFGILDELNVPFITLEYLEGK